MSEFIYDGYAVYQGMTGRAKLRTRPDNVSDVLDSLHRLEKADRQQAVPSGYVMVPVRATPEMIEAAEYVEDLYKRGTPETWGSVYRAMLAAAPQAEQAVEPSAFDADGVNWKAVANEQMRIIQDLKAAPPAPDVSGLVEALEATVEALEFEVTSTACQHYADYRSIDERLLDDQSEHWARALIKARGLIATHRSNSHE